MTGWPIGHPDEGQPVDETPLPSGMWLTDLIVLPLVAAVFWLIAVLFEG